MTIAEQLLESEVETGTDNAPDEGGDDEYPRACGHFE